MQEVGGRKSGVGDRWVGVLLCASALAGSGCGSDNDGEARDEDTEANALQPAEPTQLLSYSFRPSSISAAV